ncbi:fatty acid synthase alpha subunit Lsd1, partial [Coemansia sp. RSA 1807]
MLPSAADIAALELNEWFIYCEDTAATLKPNTPIEFCLDSEYRYKSTNVYSSINTTGTVTVQGQNGKRVTIAKVDYKWDTAVKDPVVEFLNRFKIASDVRQFADGGYLLTTKANAHLSQAKVPNSNANYAKYSLDGNPFHLNPYIADFAELPGTITHGMWTSASTRAIVENLAADGQPERIRAYRTEFTGMVFPTDQLETELVHVGMKNGRMLVKGQTSKIGGAPVMDLTAEIDQPLTAYVFTGQGSQEVGMGMALYEQSAPARAVWDRANQHMLDTYDIDLLDIVRTNPREVTVYFNGRAGERIRRNYMSLTKRSPGAAADSKESLVPIIPEITPQSSSYTFRAATGLLNATQFTQTSLVLVALAAVADMRAHGLVQKDAIFAGHSLGEYCALAAIGDIFSIEGLLDITFYRGLIMQTAVPRDAQGRSEFGMAAIDPSRIGTGFSESALLQVIDAICDASPGLLQVVNYNVRGNQYVTSGTLVNLAVLRLVLDEIASAGMPNDADFESSISQIVSQVLAKPFSAAPVRGKATIPLQGIDVPFHSRQLLGDVAEFRSVLYNKIDSDTVSPDLLFRRYIPNLTAVPFEVTQGYFEMVHAATGSPVASEILSSWTDDALENPVEKKRLAVALLVELMAYQLAAPVQWIKTQDCLFSVAEVQRMVEVGPSPVLCGMADKTLRNPSFANSSVSLLHFERNRDEIYYVHTAEEVEVAVEAASTPTTSVVVASAPATQSEQPAASPAQAQVSVGVSSSAGAAIDDVPLPAADIVHAIVAFKLKQPLSGVSAQQSIKMLVGGKSTLQNEIVGDLQKEFGTRVPDKPEDMSLQELGAAIGTSSSMGKCSQPLVARMFGSKMPGGFTLSSARAMLQTAYGLGSQRQDALLLMALTMEPAARLGSDADAGTWLATVAQAYAAHTGIAYSATQASSADGASQGPTVSSAELKKVRLREIEHIQQQIAVLARYAGIDLRSDGRTAEGYQTGAQQLQTSVDNITAEFGDDLIAGVQPRFDARKIRRFDSCWNWARQDAYEWIQQTIAVCTTGVASDVDVSDEARLQQLQNRADVQLVQMLAGTAKILGASNNDALQPAIQLTQALHDACKDSLDQEPVYREFSKPMQPETHVQSTGEVKYTEKPRPSERSWAEYIQHMSCGDLDNTPPLMHLREQTESGQWTYSDMYSGAYFSGLNSIATQGISFAGKTALVTGCGRGSIGAEIVSSLLAGGAKVLATTSSYSRATTLFFENLYRTHGSRGSELVVVPFNQGSVQDIENLVSHVYGKSGSELNWNLDYVFPFAAVSDIGSTLTNLGSRSELAQRVILTNVLRLLGRIKAAKESAGRSTRPALVVLPLSPNHGTFGGDGFYGECKIGLETAFNRWESESWEKQLAIAGAVIGWTRGTGLMSGNNLVAQNIEELGVRTYSTREMALNILGLLQPSVTRIAYRQPVWADFGGGMGRVRGLNAAVSKAREAIDTQSKILRRIATDKSLEFEMTHPVLAAFISSDGSDISPLAKHKNHTPAAKSYESLGHLRQLQGMANLDKVVVITGFGEVSPHGNAETRWEIEAFGELTMEGCIELAWIMGLVKHHNGLLPATGQQYIGWVDVKSGAPVKDVDIKPRYHEYILAHTGIRLIEPELSNGYDPAKKQALREVQIEHDMEPFEASADEAAAFKQSNGDKVDIWENASSGSWSVRFLKGALIRVPMAVSATRLVAGLLPTGWDATRFGIPEDIVKQVDPITLYTLVAAVEALVKSGITDPYELYKHFHVSEVGNTIGSGLGGVRALQEMFKHRALDRETRGDALQETFISTVQAWVNMLLMSSAGPVKPAVGACATAVLSIDTAIDTIQSGKAKVMLAGGVDDFMEESSTEFASMGATSNAVDELASGRTPSEMCRPCTTTRNGFMEGHGAGVVVLMSASAAIACGAPIHGIVGMSATATDKQGRSVPAPGQGVMGSARESSSPIISRLLNVDYRRRRFEAQLATLNQWKAAELAELEHDAAEADDATVAAYTAEIELSYKRQHAALQDTWGNEFWKQDANISPLRGSLAVWGLTADDIGMASFHGTSTQANDKNESSVLNAQLKHLGRTPGHVVPVVCQKWLTGHAKGAAASFMLNGVLQSLRSGLVPGNRNADNIAAELKQFDYSLYLSQTIQTTGIKAALLKSFGFGQVGGELLVIHPDYLLATLEQSQLEAYNTMLEQRSITSFRYWQDVLVGNHSFVQVKSQPPFSKQQEQRVYLDPQA